MKKSILILLFFLPVLASSAQENSGFAVLELFTSEGCSSCPPADQVLSDISKEAIDNHQEVYCLAYHVDYWNRLGWKDPFGKYQYTRRQENYSRVLPSKELYTPQMIVNGNTEVIGSKKEKVKSLISESLRKKSGLQLSLKLDSLSGDTAYISWKLSEENKNFVLQIAYTQSALVSKVEKGENAGKTLKHDHVVRAFTSVNNPGKKGSLSVYLPDRSKAKSSEVIGFIQQKQNYRIAGASRIEL